VDAKEAWEDWHKGVNADIMPAPSPVFEHGFRAGSTSPGISARVVWDAYCHGCAASIPPALVEGLNRGAAMAMSRRLVEHVA